MFAVARNCPRGFELFAHRARRLAIPTHGRVDLPALVQYPQHVEILEMQAALLAHQTLVMRVQPFRRPRPQLVEMIHDVEHAPITTWGYDSYRTIQRAFDAIQASSAGPLSKLEMSA
jgi:hypothetical protein